MCRTMWLLAAFFTVISGVQALYGPNVCMQQETYTESERISQIEPFEKRYKFFCINVPPVCSWRETIYQRVYKTKNVPKTRHVAKCCRGYTKSNTEDLCIPVCSKPCLHGTCVAPDECKCESGYTGPYCDIIGVNRTQQCRCQNGGTCRANDGHCRCTPGWIGTHCEEREKCEEPLLCHNAQEEEEEEAGYGSIVARIIPALIFIAITLTIVMYYRHRIRISKTKINHVQYISKPLTPPDHNQFDNPMYPYQELTKSDDGTLPLLNNIQFRNDLRLKNVTNERDKLGPKISGCGDNEDDSLKGACSTHHDPTSSLENRDADLGNRNVNVHHSEMNSKRTSDHHYDEIEENNADFEYDHLDHTPASNSRKPHYHRIAIRIETKAGSGPSKCKTSDYDLI